MVDEPVAWDSFVMPAIVVADEPVAVEKPVMEPLEALVAVADVQPFYAAEPLAEPNAAEEPDAVLFVEPAVEAVVEAEVIVAEEPAVSVRADALRGARRCRAGARGRRGARHGRSQRR